MAVEVRQMVVKSNVLQRSEADEDGESGNPGMSREAILEECRRMIADALRELRER